MREGISFRPPPPPTSLLSLIYRYSALAAHLIVSVQINSCLPEQLFRGNWVTDEENSCYLNSLVPGALGNGPFFFLCTCTMLILIQPKMYGFYSTLTHRVWWAIFSFNSMRVRLISDDRIVFDFPDLPRNSCSILRSKFGGFVVLSFALSHISILISGIEAAVVLHFETVFVSFFEAASEMLF